MSQNTTPVHTLDAPNGTRYAYRRFAKKSGVPVVFMQHFRGNLDGWHPARSTTSPPSVRPSPLTPAESPARPGTAPGRSATSVATAAPDLFCVEPVTADLTRQRITMSHYGEGRSLDFVTIENLVTITDVDGNVVDELSNPRASMAGHQGDTQ